MGNIGITRATNKIKEPHHHITHWREENVKANLGILAHIQPGNKSLQQQIEPQVRTSNTLQAWDIQKL